MSDRIPAVIVAVVLLLHLEGGRHGDKDVDRGHVDFVVNAILVKGCCLLIRDPIAGPRFAVVLLSVCHDCHCHHCVPVVVVAAILAIVLDGRTSLWQ